jgi:hypothetical protein
MFVVDIAKLSVEITDDNALRLLFANIHEQAKISRKVGLKNCSSNYSLAMMIDHEMFHYYSMYSIEDDGTEILIHQVR